MDSFENDGQLLSDKKIKKSVRVKHSNPCFMNSSSFFVAGSLPIMFYGIAIILLLIVLQFRITAFIISCGINVQLSQDQDSIIHSVSGGICWGAICLVHPASLFQQSSSRQVSVQGPFPIQAHHNRM